MKKLTNNQDGQILIIGIVFMSILLVMSAALWGYTSLQAKAGKQAVLRSQALHIAEAGIDKAINSLNNNQSFTGESNIPVGGGVYATTVASLDPNNKQITSTGYIPNATSPKAQVTVKMNVSIDLAGVAFNFGVQVGAGGLQMDNNSAINGNVYSNGNITGGNFTATIAGDATVASGGSATPDQECATNLSDFAFNQSDRKDAAQKFTPNVSGPLTKVAVQLKKTGTPSDITVRIVTNSGSQPSEAQVGGNGTIASSTVTGSYGWAEASFSSSPVLTAGTAYWVILDTSSTSSAYYVWGNDGNDTCVGDTGAYSANWDANPSPTWTNANVDFNFRTYMGGLATKIADITVTGNARANTLDNCVVDGSAYFQTNSGCTIAGTQFPGTEDSPPQAMPISQAQIDEWKATASSGGTTNGPFTVNGTVTMGPQKITGDLIVNGTLLMTGPIWVEGDITFNINSVIRVDASIGNAGVVLLADDPANPATSGYVDIANNTVIAGNNFPNSFPMILTTKTGPAMSVQNNAAGAIFYASNGTIDVFNNAGGSQITGYGIHLNNNATVTYSTGLQSATFANGPGGAWALVAGTYVIVN